MKTLSCALAASLLLAGVAVAGCGATPAVIADLNEDNVLVQSDTGTTEGAIANEAQRGCAMHGRRAVSISVRCLDEYCIRQLHLFACRQE